MSAEPIHTVAPRLTVAESPASLPCKVCGESSFLFGVVDLHTSCEEARGKRLALSGIPIYYRRCVRCGFLFTTAFDHWQISDFQAAIYNADYPLVDPDCLETRPAGNAKLIAETFGASRDSLRILDYGGGNGLLAKRLSGAGFCAQTYDPFSPWNELPHGNFDLITAFEVLEHLPQPRETVASMARLLGDPGAILFSTLLQPEDIDEQGLAWWYAAPRNGHVSLYSRASLHSLFRGLAMQVVSFNAGLHLAYRSPGPIPPFARHLRLPERQEPGGDGPMDP